MVNDQLKKANKLILQPLFCCLFLAHSFCVCRYFSVMMLMDSVWLRKPHQTFFNAKTIKLCNFMFKNELIVCLLLF